MNFFCNRSAMMLIEIYLIYRDSGCVYSRIILESRAILMHEEANGKIRRDTLFICLHRWSCERYIDAIGLVRYAAYRITNNSMSIYEN